MNTTTEAYVTRHATVWDLRAVQAAFHTAGQVVSTWHTGPAAGRVATWAVPPVAQFCSDANEWVTIVRDPSDGPEESMEMTLDFYETPDKAERHLVHTDLRGVTFVNLDNTPRATYRIPDDAPQPPFTPDEMYVQDKRIYEALSAALADLGVVAVAEDPEPGWWQCTLTANDTAETGYLLVGNWATGNPDTPKTWILAPLDKNHEYECYEQREDGSGIIDLALPLNTPVQEIAHVVADWIALNRSDLRTS